MEAYPQELEASKCFDSEVVTQISASNGRSAALTERGTVFVWGKNINHYPTKIDMSAFGTAKVKKVVCGAYRNSYVTLFVMDDGSLWSCGDARTQMLGRECTGRQVTPTKIFKLAGTTVMDVSCGEGFVHALVTVGDEFAQ